MLNCTCGGDTTVLDSRSTVLKSGHAIRRRRECLKCGQKFSTYEIPTPDLDRLANQVFRRAHLTKVLHSVEQLATELHVAIDLLPKEKKWRHGPQLRSSQTEPSESTSIIGSSLEAQATLKNSGT